MNLALSSSDLMALMLTLKLALVSTMALLLIGIPLAWWLSKSTHALKSVVEALVALPLVLPPTVLGFYLLVTFGEFNQLGLANLAFSFSGLVIGSIVYSLPFVVRPLQNTFQAIGNRPIEVASTLGSSPFQTFYRVVLPMSRQGVATAAVLAFAHTIGEFGVVLMIGGSIPGETKVLSIAIYEAVENMQYQQAHSLSLILLIFSFLVLLSISRMNKQRVLF